MLKTLSLSVDPQAFTTDFRVHWAQHPLRPEFAESTYFLYKVLHQGSLAACVLFHCQGSAVNVESTSTFILKAYDPDNIFFLLLLSSLQHTDQRMAATFLCASILYDLFSSHCRPLRPTRQATGDPYYLEAGRTILDNLNRFARVPCGFAAMKDVRTGSHEDR